jgi:hypothetical protein
MCNVVSRVAKNHAFDAFVALMLHIVRNHVFVVVHI